MTVPHIYVLYINEDIVAPSLGLIRKLCDPDSRSKPHVTIQGPMKRERLVNERCNSNETPKLELVEPGLFTSSGKTVQPQSTVFIHCDLHEQWMQYKPDYPTSLPHITLYDGDSIDFADRLMDVLSKYRWHLHVELPTNTTLKRIDINRRKRRKSSHPQVYGPKIRAIFRRLTGSELRYDKIITLSIGQRLELVNLICGYLDRTLEKDRPILNTKQDRLCINSDHGLKVVNRFRSNYGDPHKELELLFDSQEEAQIKTKKHVRHLLGQFLTPPALAIEIAQQAYDLLPSKTCDIHFGDPCIGPGTFFSALRHVLPKSSKLKTSIGVEIDGSIASITKRLWEKCGLQVHEDDFFHMPLPPKRNLIISNPPYVRHQYMSSAQKLALMKRVSQELSLKVSGRSSLYLYFMLLCHRWMQKDAVAAWLVSSEFMAASYGNALRQYLTEKVTINRVHRFDPNDLQFEGVLATSCVVLFRNTSPDPNHSFRYSIGGTLSFPKAATEVSVGQLRELDRWPVALRQFKKQRTPVLRIGDIFKVQRGIATGANNFFILPRHEALVLGIPELCLRPILPSPKRLKVEIVEGTKDGYPDIQNQLVLIDCSLPESILKKQIPKLWDYLKTASQQGILDRYIISHRRLWYRQEVRKPPPFLCTYMGRLTGKKGPFRFLWNRSLAIATNLYLFLYPIGALADAISKTPEIEYYVFEALNKIKPSILCDGGRVYGRGLYKLEPKELSNINATSLKELL